MKKDISAEKLRSSINRFVLNLENATEIEELYEQGDALKDLCNLFDVARIEINITINRKLPRNTIKDDISIKIYDEGEFNNNNSVTQTKVTAEGNIIEYKIYSNNDIDKWSDEDIESLKAISTIISLYFDKVRSKNVIRTITFEEPQFGMHNMIYFNKVLRELIAKEELDKYGIARFNLSGFSIINNHYSREVANDIMLNYVMKIENIIGSTGVVSRISGDNFIVLFNKKNTVDVIECFNGIVMDIPGKDERIKLSSTAGIVLLTNGKFDPYDLLDKADVAYKKATLNKRKTGQTYFFYDASIEEFSQKSKWFKNHFSDAVNNAEFKPYYQPKVDAKSEMLVGAEALCRWEHDGEIIYPADFIPFAEENGSICEIDFIILENVARDMRKWLDTGITPVRVSLNFSRVHMLEDDLVSKIIEIIDKYDIPHSLIEIELTETMSDVNFKELQNIIDKLHNMGIYMAVDDFGVGYSSLNLINDLPWDTLKIDKKFIPLKENDRNYTKKVKMLNNIINMAKELELECIAEGVETKEQVDFLCSKNCRIIQGYYYDMPLSSDEYLERLKSPSYHNKQRKK